VKTQRLRLHLCLVTLTFSLLPTVTVAMSGMDMPHSGQGKATASLSQKAQCRFVWVHESASSSPTMQPTCGLAGLTGSRSCPSSVANS
jgi:hypothetical protein